MTDPISTRDPEETRAVGKKLGASVAPGTIILLEGDLGTGKTTFVQGLADGLGVTGPVTSPSFVIVNEYERGGRRVGGEWENPDAITRPFLLRHVDLYRLADPAVDLDRIGFSELLHDPAAVTVIEWADRLPGPLVYSGLLVRVRFSHGRMSEERILEISRSPSPSSSG